MANYTILLIDYEPRSIERFREPLIAAGYTVEIATDGLSGIETFHRLGPDMVLVEAMIPKKHGFEVCQELKRTPHGRRTPILITTGVYKGRKYRTQALHVYGCDEYIEKPIAPEQLLEIVGRFLGSGASAPLPRATEPGPVPPEAGSNPSADDNAGTVAKSTPSDEPAADESPRTKPTSLHQAVAKDDTEDEIMARLDAILPSGGSASPQFTEPDAVVVVAAIEQDPFSQMRAELVAELDSLSVALAFEPAPTTRPMREPMPEPMPELIPSDQVVSPSVLEALPFPEVENQIAPLLAASAVIADEPPAPVVSFVGKHPRKNRKKERRSKGRSPQTAQVAPAPESVEPEASKLPIPVFEVTLPPGTIVESELESAAGRARRPAWVWASVGVVAIIASYYVFSRGVSNRTDSAPFPAPPTSAVASAPSETPSQVPEPSQPVPDSSKFVLKALNVPVPKKTPDRVAKPSVASDPSPTPLADPPTDVEPAKSEPTTIETAKTTELGATPLPGLGDSVAGVETVPDPALGAPATTIAPGSLIAIDAADTMPVSLSRRVPVYSTQARQMRLSGTVVMNVLVNENGTVDQVVLVTGVSGASLNDAAMSAAKSWTYRPATKNGVPVKVWKVEQVVFKL